MFKRALLVGSLVCAAGFAAALPQTASGQEIVETKKTTPTGNTVLNAADAPVRVQKLAHASSTPQSPRKMAAVLMPQDEALTGDSASAKAMLIQTGTGAAATYHVELSAGMVYAVVSASGEVPSGAPEQPGDTVDEPADDPLERTVAPEAERPTTEGEYPTVKVKSVEAGAEGTELFVVVQRLVKPNGDESDDAMVMVMHMGGTPGSVVWAEAPKPGGGSALKRIRFGRRGVDFIAVRINNYFDQDPSNDQYKKIRRLRYDTHPEAKAIYDEVSRQRREQKSKFFSADRP